MPSAMRQLLNTFNIILCLLIVFFSSIKLFINFVYGLLDSSPFSLHLMDRNLFLELIYLKKKISCLNGLFTYLFLSYFFPLFGSVSNLNEFSFKLKVTIH